MPIYKYVALTAIGEKVSGELKAPSVKDLQAELSGQGLHVLRHKKIYAAKLLHTSGVKLEELKLFNQELIALLRAGLTMPAAIALISERTSELGSILRHVLDDINHGCSISAAFEKHKEQFPATFIAALKIGEKSGELVKTLTRYQDLIGHNILINQQVSRALVYPLFLLLTMAVILIALFTFVMPRFVAMYAGFNAPLPAPTRALIHVVDHFGLYSGMAVLLAGMIWSAKRYLASNARFQLLYHQALFRLPLIGGLVATLNVTHVCRTLSVLLSSGVPLVQALEVTVQTFANRFFAGRLRNVMQSVTEGTGLAQSLKQQALMPATALKLIEVGEASGNLDGMLTEAAQYYEINLVHRLGKVVALVEPFLILLIGAFIGGIIIVMYLPIFSMSEIIQ